MDLNYIREFVVLANTCNYMEAAEQLFISQSALSRHIKNLEEELGTEIEMGENKVNTVGDLVKLIEEKQA